MPIRLDQIEDTPKRGIRLDEIPDDISKPKPFIGDLLPKLTTTLPQSGQEAETITPADIISGAYPYKAAKALTTGLGGRLKTAVGTEKLSTEPITPEPVRRGFLPKTPADLGMLAGMQVSPRQIAETGIDIAASPETYVGAEAVKPGLIGKPLQSLSSRLGRILPKAGEEAVPGIGQRGLSIFKQGRDYLYEKVAKPAADIINKNLKTFPEVTKKLGLKPETINLIKQHGYEKVINPEAAEELAKQAFNSAVSQKSNVFGNRINIANTLEKAKRYYNATKATNPNSPLKGLVERLETLVPSKRGFYAGVGKENIPTPTQLD